MKTEIKLFEMFAGFGGASFSLKKANIPFETVGYSEIDKFAIQCYEQNHKGKNYGDCTKINPLTLPDFDLLTAGFPCQSFSVAGKGLGELDTRGTLFYDIIRIGEVKKPKFMLLENVKGLTFKNHKSTFDKILSELDRIGYVVYWKVLNSKDYGIPQNRERVFFVCIRKDQEQLSFSFPKPEPLTLFLKDILEDNVNEKYYLKPGKVDKLIKDFKTPNTSYCIDANYSKGTSFEQYHKKKRRQIVPVLTPDRLNKRQNGRRFKTEGEPMFTLNTQDRHGILQIGMVKQTCIKRNFETPKEINLFLKSHKRHFTLQNIANALGIPKTQVEHYFRADISRAVPNPETWFKLKILLNFSNEWDKEVTSIYEKEITFESTRRVYSSEGCSPTISSTNADKIIQINNPVHSNDRVYSKEGLSPTLNTMRGGNRQPFVKEKLQIRKLTPKECFRLMGFLDDEISLEEISNSQRYKLAGNGWDTNLVSKILKTLLEKK